MSPQQSAKPKENDLNFFTELIILGKTYGPNL